MKVGNWYIKHNFGKSYDAWGFAVGVSREYANIEDEYWLIDFAFFKWFYEITIDRKNR